jgi:hypothetical protein
MANAPAARPLCHFRAVPRSDVVVTERDQFPIVTCATQKPVASLAVDVGVVPSMVREFCHVTLLLFTVERFALLALSLTRPWGWIILNLGKRIENRSWDTDYRGPLLLHSSKGMTRSNWYDAHDFVERFDPEGASRIPQPKDPALVAGAIIGYAELIGVVQPGWRFKKHPRYKQLQELEKQRHWYMGAYGFVLKNVQPTQIVPCSGMLGLWKPSPDITAQALGKAP